MTIASSSNTKTSKHSHSNSITQTTSHSLLKSDSDIDDESDDSGSLEGESEDEWAEERKMSRYIAESELEDNLSSDDDDEINSNLQVRFSLSHKTKTLDPFVCLHNLNRFL